MAETDNAAARFGVDRPMRLCSECGVRMRFRRLMFADYDTRVCRRGHRYTGVPDMPPIVLNRHNLRLRTDVHSRRRVTG